MITLNDRKEKVQAAIPEDLKFVQGRCGSEGVAFAKTMVLNESLLDMQEFIAAGTKQYTEAELHRAMEKTQHQLEELQVKLEATLLDMPALIFTAQILMLKDKGVGDAIFSLIRGGTNPPLAIIEVVSDYAAKFSKIEDAYLREKIYDIKDVGRRLLENLTGHARDHHDFQDKIVIAKELFPSDALKLFTQKIKGIILLSGGATSHVAILARSLNIPLVVTNEQSFLFFVTEV